MSAKAEEAAQDSPMPIGADTTWGKAVGDYRRLADTDNSNAHDHESGRYERLFNWQTQTRWSLRRADCPVATL
jgi:hypothetical protein